MWNAGSERGSSVKRRFFTFASALSLLLFVATVVLWMRSYRLQPRTLVTGTRFVPVDLKVSTPIGTVRHIEIGALLTISSQGPARYPTEMRFSWRCRRNGLYIFKGRVWIDNWPEQQHWARLYQTYAEQWIHAITNDPVLDHDDTPPRGGGSATLYSTPSRSGPFTNNWMQPVQQRVSALLLRHPLQPPAQPAALQRSLPCSPLLAALSVLPIWWLFAWLRRRWRASRRLCLRCGYDLRASTDRCPECGTPVPSQVRA